MERTARRLRRMALSMPVNAYLGSEEQLLAQLEISRPTFRQAARLLEHEQLLVIKVGRSGGFYAARPEVSSVIRSAVAYLEHRRATISDLFSISPAIYAEAARAAANCSDQDLRAQLSDMIADDRDQTRDQDIREFLADQTAFNELLGNMCGNPVTQLFLRIVFDLGLDFDEPPSENRLEFMRGGRETRLRLGEAILSRDPDVAALFARQQSELLRPLFARHELDRNGNAPLPLLER